MYHFLHITIIIHMYVYIYIYIGFEWYKMKSTPISGSIVKEYEETVYIQALRGSQHAHTPSLNAEGKTTP